MTGGRQGRFATDPAQVVLRWLGGFGIALPRQAARATGISPALARRALHALLARGWVEPVVGTVGGAFRLTRTGRRHARRLGCEPAARLGAGPAGVDAALARVDLAAALTAEGQGHWRSGHLVAADGTERVVLLLLRPTPPARLHAAIGRALAATGRVPLICVTPDQHAAVTAATSVAEVRCFIPPSLRGRAAAGPTWRPAASIRPLTPAQRALLGQLARHGYATTPQLAALCALSPDAARRQLRRLTAAGLTQTDRPPPRAAWSATPQGLAAIGSPLPPVPRRPARRRHSLALVELAMRFGVDATTFTTERELRAEHMRRFGPGALPPPDGRLTLADGRHVLLELELSRKSTAALHAMIARHLAAATADAVWFAVAPRHLTSYQRRLGGDARVRVLRWKPQAPP